MNHLTDPEDLLAQVCNEEIRAFITEAFTCYSAGAFRGSIVISSLALFEDIKRKVHELAAINTQAKTLDTNIKNKIKNQEVYESYLSDQLASIGIISNADKSILDKIRDSRNKSAHPSGHNPSAEEARYVMHEVITRFLSKPELYTTQKADQILNNLKTDNYFPSNNIDDINRVVIEDIANLHSGSYPYFITKLSEIILKSSGNESKNARFYTTGLAYYSNENGDLIDPLQNYFISKNADKTEVSNTLLSTICSNPKLIEPSSSATSLRIVNLIKKSIEGLTELHQPINMDHPITLMRKLYEHFDESTFLTQFSDLVKLLISRRPYDSSVASIALAISSLRQIYVDTITNNAGSSDFGTANECADKISDLDEILSQNLNDLETFTLLVGFIKSATCGAWSSQYLKNNHFNGTQKMKNKAVAHINAQEEASLLQDLSQIGINQPSKADLLSAYF